MRLLLQLLSRQQAIIDAASAENRSLTDQEREELDALGLAVTYPGGSEETE